MNTMKMTTKEFVGAELEQAYAKVFGGRVIGGFNDHGLDVTTNDTTIPKVQVKSSIPIACKFLAKSEELGQFIPICIGEPGTREEILATLKQFGGWVENGLPGRQQALREICKIRSLCGA